MSASQIQPREGLVVDGEPVLWEACQTLNGSWGYDRDNLDWKSPETLVQMLIDAVSKGGNMLLNVGPTGRGEFDARALDRRADLRSDQLVTLLVILATLAVTAQHPTAVPVE